MFDGHTAVKLDLVIGHKPMGIVDKVGDDLKLVRKSDRMVQPHVPTRLNHERQSKTQLYRKQPFLAGAGTKRVQTILRPELRIKSHQKSRIKTLLSVNNQYIF
jgi:threonine dehydrogenase-like Zn-dependent dehydrogenase